MTDSQLLAPLNSAIDAMIEDEGVKLFISHYGGPNASIEDESGISYPLLVKDWSLTEAEMTAIVSGVQKVTAEAEAFYIYKGKTFQYSVDGKVVELRLVPQKDSSILKLGKALEGLYPTERITMLRKGASND